MFTTSTAEYSGIYTATTKEGEAQSTSKKALPVEYDELGEPTGLSLKLMPIDRGVDLRPRWAKRKLQQLSSYLCTISAKENTI